MERVKPILRYPGGKYFAAPRIAEYLPRNIKRAVSPFVGGGSVELMLERSGVSVQAYDASWPLVVFWINALDNAKAVAREVRKLYPMDRSDFHRVKKSVNAKMLCRPEDAAAYFAVNRSAFKGDVFNGGYMDSRFTESSIERLEAFRAPKMSVRLSTFYSSIENAGDDFIFADPPYYRDELNRYRVRTPKNRFPHQDLFELLHKAKRWALTYDNADWVRDTYKEYDIVELAFAYSGKKSERKTELLILKV